MFCSEPIASTSFGASSMRAASAVVMPSRCPVLRSYRRTQWLSVYVLQPIFGAIDSMAAHGEPYSLRDSNTMRTARSRTSGENFVDFFIIAPSSQKREPPQFPGGFTGFQPDQARRQLGDQRQQLLTRNLWLDQRRLAVFINTMHRKDVLGEIDADGDNGHDFPFHKTSALMRDWTSHRGTLMPYPATARGAREGEVPFIRSAS